MSEQVFFNEGGVLVTNNRVVSGNNTSSVRAITSSTTTKDSIGDFAGGCMIILVGFVFWLLASLIVGGLANILGGPDARDAALFFVFLLALGIVIYGIKEIATANRYSYSIHLHMASGQNVVLTNRDADYHRRLLRAINDAMATQTSWQGEAAQAERC